jgi:uncharacterized cupin superfamily protein
MPKIDIDKITPDIATGYPSPFNKAVEGRSRKRLARAAGLSHFGVNICTLKPGAASSTCSKAKSCCARTAAK